MFQLILVFYDENWLGVKRKRLGPIISLLLLKPVFPRHHFRLTLRALKASLKKEVATDTSIPFDWNQPSTNSFIQQTSAQFLFLFGPSKFSPTSIKPVKVTD